MLALSGSDTATASFPVSAVTEVFAAILVVDVSGRGCTVHGTWGGQILPVLARSGCGAEPEAAFAEEEVFSPHHRESVFFGAGVAQYRDRVAGH